MPYRNMWTGGKLHPFLKSELVEAECSTKRTGLFTSRKTPLYPVKRILGGVQNQPKVSEKGKISYSLSGFEPRTVTPVA